MDSKECPGAEALQAFVKGDLPEEKETTIVEHLDGCTVCESAVGSLERSSGSFISELLRSYGDEQYLREPEFSRALMRAKQIGRESLSESSEISDHQPAEPSPLGSLGQYSLLAKLGEGGMGTVYKARHTHLQKIVALKVLADDRTKDARAITRFKREMQAVGSLDHPNIVLAHDAGEAGGNHYLAMEYIEGLDLSKLAKRCGPLPVADACEIVRQAAVGLQAVHEHSLVHRDIKPSNLMLLPSGQVKILDLGLARLRPTEPDQENITAIGQVMGTADYLAPEQALEPQSVDIRADCYSLGCTLYQLLSGNPPFSGPQFDSRMKKIMGHSGEPVPPIQDRRNDVPESLVAVVNRLLAKKPVDRYATPSQLAEALEPLAVGGNLEALYSRAAETGETRLEPLPGPIPQAKKVGPRRAQKIWLSVTALLAIVALVATIIYIRTDKGTLVIEINEPDIRVTIDEKEVNIRSPRDQIQLRVGKHQLKVTKDGFITFTKSFSIQRGDKIELAVKLESNKYQLAEPLSKTTASVKDGEAKGVYLSDMQEFNVRVLTYNGVTLFSKKGQTSSEIVNRSGRIIVNEVYSANGIFMHPETKDYASASYQLNRKYRSFKGTVAIMNPPDPTNPVWEPVAPLASPLIFEVIGNGKILWRSEDLTRKGQTQAFQASMRDVDTLEIRVRCPGLDGFAWAVWIDPYLELLPGQTVPTPQLSTTPSVEGSVKAGSEKKTSGTSSSTETISFGEKIVGTKWSWENRDGTGWIKFQPNHRLSTHWGPGTWSVSAARRINAQWLGVQHILEFTADGKSFHARRRTDGQVSNGRLLDQ